MADEKTEVRTVSQLKAELKAELLAELEKRLKSGFSELKDSFVTKAELAKVEDRVRVDFGREIQRTKKS